MSIKKVVVIAVGVVALSTLDILLSQRSKRKKAQSQMLERDVNSAGHKESDSST